MSLFLQLYYFLLPFVAFFGIGLRRPDLIFGIAAVGWLPLIMFYYFSYAKIASVRPTPVEWLVKAAVIVVIGFVQFVLLQGSIWSFFSSVLVFELASFSLAIAMYMVIKIPEAWKDEMMFPIVVTILLLGGSSGYIVYSLLNIEGLWVLNVSTACLLGAFLFDLYQEFMFFKKITDAKDKFDDSGFEDKIPMYALSLIFWIVGMPAILTLVTS